MSGKIHLYCVREGIHLPNEILAIIMNELASDREDNDSLAALASCRLASHPLYSLATPLLFSSIQLIESAKYNDKVVAFMKRAAKLSQILTTSEIAVSVHTLTLRCQKANFQDWTNGIIISAILRCLPHIRTFILECEGAMLNFTAIVGNFKSAIESLCRSPNLTTLDLDNIVNFPVAVITGAGACPNLQCLRLSRVLFHFDYANSIDETSSLQPYELGPLEIDDLIYNLFNLDNSDYYCGTLLPFGLENLFRDHTTLKCGWGIMLLALQSLTTLDISWCESDQSVYRILLKELGIVPFDLGRFPALRHFKIQIRSSPESNAPMLFFLNQLLSISSSTNGIETLEIIITWEYVRSRYERGLFSSDAEPAWSRLKDVLSSEKFVSLQKVLGLRLEMQGGDCNEAYYHSRGPEPGGSAPPYVNSLFSMLGP